MFGWLTTLLISATRMHHCATVNVELGMTNIGPTRVHMFRDCVQYTLR